MQVNKRGLRDIFTSTITYVVPLFQRPYVWERDQNWEPFWESIESVADAILCGRSRQHFLGAVVLEQIQTATGAEPIRNTLLHTIGNLTLLTGKLNESISNGAWDMKRPEILKHNSINLNREFQDDNFATWDENKIKLRSERLAKLFCRAFPRG